MSLVLGASVPREGKDKTSEVFNGMERLCAFHMI